jgi:hypothetical protein
MIAEGLLLRLHCTIMIGVYIVEVLSILNVRIDLEPSVDALPPCRCHLASFPTLFPPVSDMSPIGPKACCNPF